MLIIVIVGVNVVNRGAEAKQDDFGGIPLAEGASEGTTLSPEQLNKVLADHAKALQEGNKKAYLSIFDKSNKRLMAQQRQLFENLQKVPFKKVNYKSEGHFGSTVNKFGEGIHLKVNVAFVHQIEGVDVRPVFEWYSWKVIKKPGKKSLTVTKVSGSSNPYGEGGELVYYPAPWDAYDNLTVVQKPHVVIMANEQTKDLATRYASTFERAAKYDLSVWNRNAPKNAVTLPGFSVTLEHKRGRFARMYGREPGESQDLAGFSQAMPSYESGGNTQASKKKLDYGGARIMLVTSGNTFFQTGTTGVQELARHEMAHSLVEPLRSQTYNFFGQSPFQHWVVEGFAEYMALRDGPVQGGAHFSGLSQYMASGKFDGTLPSNTDVYSDSLTVSNANYQLGYLALRFLAQKRGEDAVFKLMKLHYHEPYKLDKHIQKVSGMSKAQFEAQWSNYVRSVV